MMKCIQTGILDVNTYIFSLGAETRSAVIVDPGGSVNLIRDYLESQLLLPVLTVLTHGHFDHIFGLADLKELYPEMNIAVHQCDRMYLNVDAVQLHIEDLKNLGITGLSRELSKIPVPDVLLSNGDTLASGLSLKCSEKDRHYAEQWRVISTPGHTPGSICLYNSLQGILISGDTLFYGSYGRTDLHGGNMKDLRMSLSKLGKLPPSVSVYPGHGPFGFSIFIPEIYD